MFKPYYESSDKEFILFKGDCRKVLKQVNKKFDLVLMLHVLEHVDDPVGLLSSVKAWITPFAPVIIVVPNAHSIHRLLGVKINLIKNVHELGESDLRVGHKRVYDRRSLIHDIVDAELNLTMHKGFFFKPFNNLSISCFLL